MRICIRCNEEYPRKGPSRGMCYECGRMNEKDYLRRRARSLVARAIRNGDIPKASSLDCKDCGNKAFCYDHRDYYRPLKIDAVCKKCDSRRGPGYPPIPNKNWSRKYPVNNPEVFGTGKIKL